MDNQDQRRAHTPGHESHGVHVCHKCGWPFPNPHPSAKHRRAHKKICGTIEGYKLCVSEGQAHLNGSDDEHASDDDHKTPGPNALDSGHNEKVNDVIREKSIRSEDEVFSDAVADFSDSGLSQGIKEHLQEDSLDSGTIVEKVDIKDPKLSESSEDNDFNAAEVSQLTVKSSDECKIQNPKVLQSETVEVGNSLELQGQLSGSAVDALSSSIADLRAEELAVVHGDDSFGLSGDSSPSKAEAMPDELPENKIYSSENVTDCSLTSDAKETNLKGKDEIKSELSQLTARSSDDCEIQNPKVFQSEMVEVGNTLELQGQLSGSTADAYSGSIADLRAEELTVVHGDDSFGLSGDSCPSKAEAMPDELPENKIYSSENVTDFRPTSDAKETNLKGKDEIKSDGDEVEIVVPSDNVVGETFEGEFKIEVSDPVHSDHQVADGAVDLKEKNSAEFLSVPAQDDVPVELNSVVITNASTNEVRAESAHVIQFATSSDVYILQEKEEGNVNVDTLLTLDDRPDVAHPQSEYEDFKDQKGVMSQTPLSLHSSESLKHEEDDLKDTVTEENSFAFYPSQLTEKSDILSLGMDVVDHNSCMKKELVNREPMAKEMHAEDSIDVIPVKPMVESCERIDETGVSLNAVKIEMNESHMLHFSEEQGPGDDHKNSPQICLRKGSLMALPNENLTNASFGSATSEATGVISIDNISAHEKNRTEINDVAVDGKDVRANADNDIGTKVTDFQSNDLQLDVKQPSEFKSGDAGEMDKIEKCDISDAQSRGRPIVIDTSLPQSASSHIESPVISEAVIDGSTGKSKGIECTDIGPMSGAQEDTKEEEINSNIKVHEKCDRSFDTSADSHQARDAELLVKAAEDLSGKHTSLSSLNNVPSAQHASAVGDNQDGERSREVPGITAVPVNDQSVNNLVKHSSSGIDASVDSGSRCDSLEGNWGSVSVLSMQSDAPVVTDTETLHSTGSLASTEAGKSNMSNPKAASERQQSGKSEMFEAPSFMTLIEPRVVSSKGSASGVQKNQNLQQPSSTSQAGWFPTLTQVINESPGRKKNEEIIAKVTNWSASKEHTPLKSLLGEAAHGNKPKSPKMEENSVNKKGGKIPENNGSGLTTVNSILGPESPGAQALKEDAAKEWNSPARYPADIKREKKVKSRPFWIQLVCCSTVDPQRR